MKINFSLKLKGLDVNGGGGVVVGLRATHKIGNIIVLYFFIIKTLYKNEVVECSSAHRTN